MARRHIDRIVKQAVLEELRQGAAAKDLAVKYSISEASISRWRKAAGIDDVPYANAIARSRPLKLDEDSSEASPADRRTMINKMVSLVTDLAEGGGLKSHDVKNLSLASKALNEASERLEREEQSRVAYDPDKNGSRGRSIYDTLVDGTGLPRNLQIYFGVLHWAEHRDNGDNEAAEDAADRVIAGAREEGFRAADVDLEKMLARIYEANQKRLDREEEERKRKILALSPDERKRRGLEEVYEQFNGQGLERVMNL